MLYSRGKFIAGYCFLFSLCGLFLFSTWEVSAGQLSNKFKPYRKAVRKLLNSRDNPDLTPAERAQISADAQQEAEAILRQFPDYADLHLSICGMFVYDHEAHAYLPEELVKQSQILLAAADKHPGDPEWTRARATAAYWHARAILLAEGKVAAHSWLNQVVVDYPNSQAAESALTYLQQSFYSEDEEAALIADYETIIAKTPVKSWAHENALTALARLYYKSDRWDELKALYRSQAANYPKDNHVWLAFITQNGHEELVNMVKPVAYDLHILWLLLPAALFFYLLYRGWRRGIFRPQTEA